MTVIKYIVLILTIYSNSTVFAKEKKSIERLAWKKDIQVSGVNLINLIGDVRIRPGKNDTEIEIIALVQHNEVVGRLTIQESIENETYHLSVGRIDETTGQAIALNQGDQARLDLTVFVPLNKQVKVETDQGLIESRKMKAPVSLRSKSGSIMLRANKNVTHASTEHGDIVANLLPTEARLPQSFETESGDIKVWIAENANYQALLETSGNIASDFSTQVNRDFSQEPNKSAQVLNGGDVYQIHAKSKLGDIEYKANPVLNSETK